MAGTSGFFLKGLAGGLEGLGTQVAEMTWQKREKERIQKEKDALMETVSITGKKFDSFYQNYNVDDNEKLQAQTIWLALSQEAQGLLKGSYDAVMNTNKDVEEQNLATLKAYREDIEGVNFDLSTIPEIYEYYKGRVKGPEGMKLFNACDRMLKKKNEALQGQQPEGYNSPDELLKAHPGADWEFNPSIKKYILKDTTVTQPSALSAKDNWAIEHYNLPEGSPEKISFDQLSRYMGATPETPEKATTLEEEISTMKAYGASNEEIKNHLIGKTGAGGIEPETVTTLKNWEDIFNIKSETGPKTEEEYNRALELLTQSKDNYKPKYASWKEVLISEVKLISQELKGYAQDKSTKGKDNFKRLLNIYMQKLEEIKTKYPEVNLSQFPTFEEQKGWFQKLKEKVGLK